MAPVKRPLNKRGGGFGELTHRLLALVLVALGVGVVLLYAPSRRVRATGGGGRSFVAQPRRGASPASGGASSHATVPLPPVEQFRGVSTAGLSAFDRHLLAAPRGSGRRVFVDWGAASGGSLAALGAWEARVFGALGDALTDRSPVFTVVHAFEPRIEFNASWEKAIAAAAARGVELRFHNAAVWDAPHPGLVFFAAGLATSAVPFDGIPDNGPVATPKLLLPAVDAAAWLEEALTPDDHVVLLSDVALAELRVFAHVRARGAHALLDVVLFGCHFHRLSHYWANVTEATCERECAALGDAGGAVFFWSRFWGGHIEEGFDWNAQHEVKGGACDAIHDRGRMAAAGGGDRDAKRVKGGVGGEASAAKS